MSPYREPAVVEKPTGWYVVWTGHPQSVGTVLFGPYRFFWRAWIAGRWCLNQSNWRGVIIFAADKLPYPVDPCSNPESHHHHGTGRFLTRNRFRCYWCESWSN